MFAVIAAGAALLVLTGLAKLRRPEPAGRALRAVGLPAAGRALGLTEVCLGGAGLISTTRPVLAVIALTYLAFAGFVIVARRPGSGIASCGCAGQVDAPPTWTHAALDIGIAGAVLAAVFRPPSPVWANLGQPSGVIGGLLAAVLCALLWLAVTALPRLTARQALLRG
ncbi:MAG TPA: MauE/DoxX family redox-associated membrane protein [Mycobacteriales bacterium]|nr:MauE/DoxX family redox-associated membrane protein [Mycobacteriales bacterium]